MKSSTEWPLFIWCQLARNFFFCTQPLRIQSVTNSFAVSTEKSLLFGLVWFLFQYNFVEDEVLIHRMRPNTWSRHAWKTIFLRWMLEFSIEVLLLLSLAHSHARTYTQDIWLKGSNCCLWVRFAVGHHAVFFGWIMGLYNSLKYLLNALVAPSRVVFFPFSSKHRLKCYIQIWCLFNKWW